MAAGLDHETDLVIIHDTESVVYASHPARTQLRLASNGADHLRPVPELVTEEYRDALSEQFERVDAEEAEVRALTAPLAHVDASPQVAVILSSAVRWAGDDLVLSVVIRTDPPQADDQRSGTLDSGPLGITISDAVGDDLPVMFLNDDFTALTGYPRDEVLGRSLRWLLGDGNGQDVMDVVSKGVETRESVTVEHGIDRKDGTTFWSQLTVTPLFDSDDELTHLLASHRDITARLASQRERTLFDSGAAVDDTAIFVTDTQGVIEYVNEPFERATGYAFEEAVGQTPSDLRSGEQGRIFYQTLSETITPGEVWDSQVTIRRKSGDRYVVDRKIVPITDRNGQICNFVTIEQEPGDRSLSE